MVSREIELGDVPFAFVKVLDQKQVVGDSGAVAFRLGSVASQQGNGYHHHHHHQGHGGTCRHQNRIERERVLAVT